MANMDVITKKALEAIDIILLSHPKKTSIGILIGIIPAVVIYTFETQITSSYGIQFGFPHYILCLVLGILIMNIKTIIDVFHGNALNEEYAAQLKSIEESKVLTKAEKRELIIKLISSQIEKLSPEQVKKVQAQVMEK
ncbi:hypothetical protein [Morganella morganii]|uniref:hypothetical protein n=1 Tax=Morganella morganii TaxID=582 RepID=UPI003B9DD9F3